MIRTTLLAVSLLIVGHAAQAAPAMSHEMQEQRAAMEVMHQGMDIEPSGDADTDFVRSMIPHHQGAISMSRIYLDHHKGENGFADWLAAYIIRWQEMEVNAMRQWLLTRGYGRKVTRYGGKEAAAELAQTAHAMHQHMQHADSGDAAADFMRGMIPHHEAALDMAATQLKHGRDRDMRRLALSIIRSQTIEIGWMQGWLARHAENHSPSQGHRHHGR